MPNRVRPLLDGALAGAVGTATMSAVMLGAQRAGLMGQQPPEKIAQAALDKVGVTDTDDGEEDVLATVAHFCFGASMGAAFGLLHREVDLPVVPMASGSVFGLAVWALAYKGVVPGLGIMPPPEHDRPGRPTSMVLGHLVWGATTGWVVGQLDHRQGGTA